MQRSSPKLPHGFKRLRLVGMSKVTLEMLSQIATLAPSESNVLIRGESGTGKDVVARLSAPTPYEGRQRRELEQDRVRHR